MAELDETRCFRTYLRRLSYRSKQHPGAFQLRNVEISPQFSKMCSHGRGAAQKPTEGVFGRVFHAKWSKPDGTIVVVAIKSILVSQIFLSRLWDLKVSLYRTRTAIRVCYSMKLLFGITSTPIMWFHFMALHLSITRRVLFRCGWMEGVYVATWMGKRIPSV